MSHLQSTPFPKSYIAANTLEHPALIKSLQKAYSAEKAAAYAYQGHAASLRKLAEKIAIRQIEADEWNHRAEVLLIMQHYNIPVSRLYEIRFAIIGRLIAASCFLIGWFMPFFFAGKLESGNVCEYFRMKQYFNSLGLHQWDLVLYEMGMKEKEHEIYFRDKVKESRVLPFFERLFNWGINKSANNIDLDKKYPVENSDSYCRK
ncbi:MAG: hypothetical protein V4717_12865 [Bacteroidota bacterium]